MKIQCIRCSYEVGARPPYGGLNDSLTNAVVYFNPTGEPAVCQGCLDSEEEGIEQMKEADIKRAVADYLQLLENQGELWFERLNSGDFIEARGDTRRRVHGCRRGTADFIAIRKMPDDKSEVLFLEIKSTTGRQSPEQKDFENTVKGQRCRYHIIRDLQEVMDFLGEIRASQMEI